MKKRAVLLPHPADPFMFAYWLKFFNEVWGAEVDTLYVYINSPIEKPVIEYIRDLCSQNPKINYQYNPSQVEHGYAIDRMLDIVTEKYVMLIEDDGFIFKPGHVNKYFSLLESGAYDLIGSPRGSCSQEIWDRAKELWGLDYSGFGDVGPNFWPCYLFTTKQALLTTSRNFGAKAWKQGEIIAPLGNYAVKGDICVSDTLVEASLELRAAIPKNRILTIPQYHGSPDDIEHFDKKQYLFDGLAPWTHVGSLSSGTHGVLMDGSGRALARRFIDAPKANTRIPGDCKTLQEHNEWERRVQWWKTFWEYGERGGIPDYLGEFSSLYKSAIDRIIRDYTLNVQNIEIRQRIYKTLGL